MQPRSACTNWCTVNSFGYGSLWIMYQVICYLTWIMEFTWHLALPSALTVFWFPKKVGSIASAGESWEGLDFSTWDDPTLAVDYRNAKFPWDKSRLLTKCLSYRFVLDFYFPSWSTYKAFCTSTTAVAEALCCLACRNLKTAGTSSMGFSARGDLCYSGPRLAILNPIYS